MSQRKLKHVIGSPCDKEPTYRRNTHSVRYPKRTGAINLPHSTGKKPLTVAATKTGAETLLTEDMLALLAKYQEGTAEFA